MPLSDRQVAVTGATGFLGSHVLRRMDRDGARVRAVFRNPAKGRGLVETGYDTAVADLADPDAMTEAFRGVDAVVATAALATRGTATWEDFYAANARGSDHLLEACARAGVPRVVYISTIGVYQVRLWRTHGEDTPLLGDEGERVGWSRFITNPRYARSKAIGERRARERADAAGIALTVLRPGPIYGSRDHKMTSMYARWMRRLVAPAPTVRLPHVHAGDVAAAVSGALQNPASAGRAYNVTGPSVSPWHVLREWKARAGHGPALIPIPLPVWVDFDDGAAERDLGFRARSIGEGIDEILENGLPAETP